MIASRLEYWALYSRHAAWRRSFEFLEALTPDAEDSDRIPLLGDDLFARIMRYPTRAPEDAILEAHDDYIDIQMSLENSEAIDVFSRAVLEVKTPYDSEKDRTLFHRTGAPVARLNNFPGFFTVLFPNDAHMPQLMTGNEPETVKKVVVKLRVALLGENGLG